VLNLVTGHIYIGSGITSMMQVRFHKHLYSFQGNKLVAAAVKKYGLQNFAFVVLETTAPVLSSADNDVVIDLENLYISEFLPEYNIAPTASNTYGYKHTAETKAAMRANYSDERRARIGDLNKGNTLFPETIAKIRASATGRMLSPASKMLVSQNSANAFI
jgi:group I intron endonuclease